MANEKRLVDAAKLYEDAMDEYRKANYCDSCLDTTINLIDDAPTVDAVEVVRCGACKEWLEIEETGGAGYCHHPCWIIANAEPPIVQFNDFCSYGERKDNGSNI